MTCYQCCIGCDQYFECVIPSTQGVCTKCAHYQYGNCKNPENTLNTRLPSPAKLPCPIKLL